MKTVWTRYLTAVDTYVCVAISIHNPWTSTMLVVVTILLSLLKPPVRESQFGQFCLSRMERLMFASRMARRALLSPAKSPSKHARVTASVLVGLYPCSSVLLLHFLT